VAELDLRFRAASPGLLSLPWDRPLDAWRPEEVALRDLPVGPSRHLVRFVEVDGARWALKALPRRLAEREYAVLRELEARSLAAVRVAGVVAGPGGEDAVLVTRFLERSWQYRRLLLRLPAPLARQRSRLLDAIAVLVVDLHRHGIYWGDCSLANALFMRDGQAIQAWMVDAETAEVHRSLSDGQRQADLDILVENVLGGLLDVAAAVGEDGAFARCAGEAEAVVRCYEELWRLLHEEPVVTFEDRYQVEGHLRRLNEAGFAVDEVRLVPAGSAGGRGTGASGAGELRLEVAVAARAFHSRELRRLTGLDVGEGQARVLLNDLHGHQVHLQHLHGAPVSEAQAAEAWMEDVFGPMAAWAHRAVGGAGDRAQAYCDLLEVRWLLSEQADRDVGDAVALDALAQRQLPEDSAAALGIVDVATRELPVYRPEEPPG
jgi:hypothetical protein